MYSDPISDPQVRKFIQDHLQDNIQQLALQSHSELPAPMAFLLNQIKFRQKNIQRFPTLTQSDLTVFPSGVSTEQASSEVTAVYKADLVSGALLMDLTGGLGVDCMAFSKRFTNVIHLERYAEIQQSAAHNFNVLGFTNIQSEECDSIEFIENTSQQPDVIFLDPARRDSKAQKVFKIEDCEPNLLEILPLLQQKSKTLLVKLAPMLDINDVLNKIKSISEIHIISVKNDCKEILLKIEKETHETKIYCANLETHQAVFSFIRNKNLTYNFTFSEAETYLYEPNSSVMKSGAFKELAQEFGLKKIAPNTHIFTSEVLKTNFPGRIFQFEKELAYAKKEVKKAFPESAASISCRNFPDKPELVKKKLQLKESSTHTLFAVKNSQEKPILLLCKKL